MLPLVPRVACVAERGEASRRNALLPTEAQQVLLCVVRVKLYLQQCRPVRCSKRGHTDESVACIHRLQLTVEKKQGTEARRSEGCKSANAPQTAESG